MKKVQNKIIAAILCMVLSVSVLAGCGGSGNGNDSTTAAKDTTETPANTEDTSAEQTTDSSVEETDEWTGEISKIVMAFPTAGVEPTDLGLVQDAVNEITMKKIGVEVQFKPVSLFEASSQIPMWIGAGEQLDLMFIAFSGLRPYVDQGMIEPIEDYLAECGPYIQSLADAGDPIYDTIGDGHIYGTMVIGPAMNSRGYVISVEDLEAAGLSYENEQKVTMAELDTIFEKIKAAKPDVYPCGVFGNLRRAGFTFESDSLGATTASGVLIGIDSTEVVNYYESEQYKSYLEYVRSWYEKGYILKDAATTDYSWSELSKEGTISGYFNDVDESLRKQLELNNGRPYVNLALIEPYKPSVTAASNTYWSVPVTAANPEAAVRFLNLLYEDSRISNTLIWGIEGKHWVYENEAEGIITFPEGVDSTNTTYSYGFGLFGDHRNSLFMGGRVPKETLEKNAEIANSRITKGYGFAYDTTAMTNQIIAVEAVVSEYISALETGSADLETVYPEFINKLKANGIDEIIADKQAQFDAWLEQQ